MKKASLKYLAQFTAIIWLISCSKGPGDLIQTDFAPINPDNVSLTLINDNIIANGTTMAEFLLKIDAKNAKRYKDVTLGVYPSGRFSNGSAILNTTVDVNGEARIFVNSVVPGIAYIKAEISSQCSKTASVHFTNSFPEQILIQPSVGSIVPDFTSNATIIAKLIKSTGSVSTGIQVNYYDSTSTDRSVGVFISSTTSDSSGESTAIYSIQDTSYHGLVYIKGYVNTSSGRITGYNKILIR